MGIHFFFKAQISEFKIRFCSQKAQDSILATSLHTSYIILGKLLVSALLTMPKPLTVWITTNCGKFWKSCEYQTTWPASWETYMQVRKQQLELDMEQQTDSKLGKEYVKAVYWHSAYLTYMQTTSWEMLGWMKNKLKSRLLGKILTTSDRHIIPL